MPGLAANGAGATLEAKVGFLSRPDAYRPVPGEVTRHETHMSQVFLAGGRVYKLKKPVRFPYLDFSTLARREAACRAELKLNRRLAPDVYQDVVPLVRSGERARPWRRWRSRRLAGCDEPPRRHPDAGPCDWGGAACTAGSSIAWRLCLCSSIAAPMSCSSRLRKMPQSCGAALPSIAVFCSTRAFHLPPGRVRRVIAMQRRFLMERAPAFSPNAFERGISSMATETCVRSTFVWGIR